MAKLYSNSVNNLSPNKTTSYTEKLKGPSENTIKAILSYSKSLKFYKNENINIGMIHN